MRIFTNLIIYLKNYKFLAVSRPLKCQKIEADTTPPNLIEENIIFLDKNCSSLIKKTELVTLDRTPAITCSNFQKLQFLVSEGHVEFSDFLLEKMLLQHFLRLERESRLAFLQNCSFFEYQIIVQSLNLKDEL
jgi:hypothetical protein